MSENKEVEKYVILHESGHLALKRKFDSFHTANSFIAMVESEFRKIRATQRPSGYHYTRAENNILDDAAMLGRKPKVTSLKEAMRGIAREELGGEVAEA